LYGLQVDLDENLDERLLHQPRKLLTLLSIMRTDNGEYLSKFEFSNPDPQQWPADASKTLQIAPVS